jgi:CRISPR/Cas system-associated exonuclease Cas4 (RecB family)
MTTYQLTREFGHLIDQIEFDIPADILKAHPPKSYTPRKVSASGIKDCSRQWFYKLSKDTQRFAREKRQESWDRAAAEGTLIHDQIQRTLIDYGVVDSTEAYLPRNDHFTSGRIDGRLTGRKCLLEIKTVGARAWAEIPDHDKFAGYQDQIQLYLEELDLPQALLICVRREPIIAKPKPEDRKRLRQSLCKEFVIERDRERGRYLIAKAMGIREAIDRKVVPAAEPSDSCFFCAFQHLCRLQDLTDEIQGEETTAE